MARHIGRYEILAEIGRGGFGHVYRGLDPTVGRPVAIKVLTSVAEEGMLSRFRGEATASGRLRHANIITVYDFGEQDGVPFIVMELLDGQDLQHVIESRKLPPLLQQIQIMSQIAGGLRHAHAAGIIHRDVKPANVMLLADGNIKLMDFGIALITQSTHSRLTPRGAMIGTFRYMAPEQFRGAEPDARSDIFAYGLIFYELLSGVHPFHAAEAAAQMFNILSVEPVPIGEICPNCPRELQAVVARLLQKDPEARYQSFDDVMFDIEPPLIKLRQGRAGELLQEAQAAKDGQQLETAQTLIRQVLELSPGYEGARDLREQIQQEMRRQTIRPKVEDLLRKGKEALATGNPDVAVARFESAIRLDPVAAEIKSLLQEARSNADKLREAARLTAEADAALREGDPTRASRLAQQALELAPLEARAKEVVAESEAILAREREKALLAEAIGQARRLLQIHSWPEAAALLRQIDQKYPERADIRSLLEEVRVGQEKEQRERSLAAGLSAARQDVQQGDLKNALARLQALGGNHPESEEVRKMLDFVRIELETQNLRTFVNGCLEEARSASASGDLARSVKILENALLRYPADQDLQRERRRFAAEQREALRRQAVDKAVAVANQLRSQRQWPQALEALDTFEQAHGSDSGVFALREAILQEREATLRQEELYEFIRKANQLLEGGNAAAAATMLQESPPHLRDNPQVTKMLGAAQIQLNRQAERKDALEKALSETHQFNQKGLFDRAFGVLNAFRSRYGTDPQTEAAREEVQKAERGMQRAADDLLARATALLSADPAGASVMLSAAPAPVRDRPEIQSLEQAAAQAARDKLVRDTVDSAVSRARELSSNGAFDEALTALDHALSQFPDQPPLLSAREETIAAKDHYWREIEELERQEREVQGGLARAAELVQNRPAEAVKALEDLQRRYDRAEVNSALAQARERLRALQEQAEREQKEREVQARQREQALREQAEREQREREVEARKREQVLQEQADREQREREAEARKRKQALREQTEREQKEREVKAGLARAKELVQDRPGDAVKALEDLQKRHNRPEISAALTQARQRAQVLQEQAEREQKEREVQARQREQALREQTEREQKEREAEAHMREKARREQAEREQAAIAAAERQAIIAEIDGLLAKGKLAKARSIHQKAVERFGNDDALEELLTRLNTPAAPKTSPSPAAVASPRKPVWAIAAAGGVVLLAGGIWMMRSRGPAPAALMVPVEIRTDPQGASVQLGERACVTPNCQLRLAPGSYTVQARLNGYDEAQQTITVQATQALAAVDLTLRPTAPPPLVAGRSTGTLVVDSGTPNALVFVDNAPIGRTDERGRLTSPVAAAAHQIRVEKMGFETARERKVTVAANRTQSIAFSLAPQNAKLELSGAPAGVEIRANGTLLGTTDGAALFSASIKPGDQNLRISQGAGARDLSQIFAPGQTVSLEWARVSPPAAAPVPTPAPAQPAPVQPSAPDPSLQAWESVRSSSDLLQVQSFLDKYPASPRAGDARARMREIQNGLQEAAWNAVNQKDVQSLQTFAQKYPGSPHVKDAQTIIDQLDKLKLESDERAKQEQSKQQQAKQALDAENPRILAVVERFNFAFSKQNQRELKAVWPDAPKSYLAALTTPHSATKLTALQPPVIAGAGATLLCNLTIESAPSRTSQQVTVVLQKTGADWTILSLRANR